MLVSKGKEVNQENQMQSLKSNPKDEIQPACLEQRIKINYPQ